MLNPKLKLNPDIFLKDVSKKASRDGFGKGMAALGKVNEEVVALAADLKDSVKLTQFEKKFPRRFFETGIAEQNMASIGAGLALGGKIPFICSHAIFSPSRNWDQIRVSIALTNANVKIIGSHAGFSNGPDGAVAESLEDIALMRVLPNMVVINTIDFEQTKKAVGAISKHVGPVYLRFAKTATPEITTLDTPFEIGKAQVLAEGEDVTVISTGAITYEALASLKILNTKHKINTEIVSCPTIKPLDKKTILKSVKKTGIVVTVEEHQITGGLGGAVAELVSEEKPVPLLRIGMNDQFGESGSYSELLDKYGLSAHNIAQKVANFVKDNA